MTFVPSTTPDITEGIPTALSLATQASSQVFDGKGKQFDIAIGGIAFLVGATAQHLYQRETAPIQKDQIDTSKEAGEQTLEGYWIRSQVSWHLGAGIRFYEPTSQPDTEYRFDDSLGVDVWRQNRLTLLHSCSQYAAVTSGQVAQVTGAVISGADVIFTNENGVIRRRSASGAILQTYTSSGSTPSKQPCIGGGKVFVDAGTTGIDSADATSGTTLAHLYTQAAGNVCTPYWVKDRLVVTRGNAVYELAPDGSTASGNIDNATPLFTHPDAGWTWTAVSEGPNNVYAAGYSGGRSVIYKFVLEDAGINNSGIPKLSQGYPVLTLPQGEHIYSLHSAMGRFLGIGTSKGFRIGLIAKTSYITLAGELDTGPILFYTANPVRSITSSDRFMYVAVQNGYAGIIGDPFNSFTGAIRVDLSQMIGGEQGNSIRFAWASDAQPKVNDRIDSIAMIGNSAQVAMGIYQNGVYGQSATLLEPTGWIRSGRIRYSTVLPKMFRTMDINVETFSGSLDAYSVDKDGNELYLRTLNASASDSGISLHAQNGAFEFLQFKQILHSSSDNLTSPVMTSMHIRALPTVKRQRLIQYPLICMDFEQFATAPRNGYEGFAISRLKGLEAIEELGLVVTVQDWTTDETFQATIEKITFTRPGPRATDGRKNFGGFLDVTVKKLNE